MAETYPRRHPDLEPTHPGEVLKDDVLPALHLSVTAAAKQLGVTRQTLHRILAGTTSVTSEMAIRIGKFCGNGPGLWLRMQVAHDLWHAERAVDVSAIPTHRAA